MDEELLVLLEDPEALVALYDHQGGPGQLHWLLLDGEVGERLLRLLLNVCCEDWQEVAILRINLLKRRSQSVTDLVHFQSWRSSPCFSLLSELLHEAFVLPLQELLLLLREHEVKLAAALVVAERVDKEVQVVDLAYLLDKLVDFAQEIGRVNIIEQVDV